MRFSSRSKRHGSVVLISGGVCALGLGLGLLLSACAVGALATDGSVDGAGDFAPAGRMPDLLMPDLAPEPPPPLPLLVNSGGQVFAKMNLVTVSFQDTIWQSNAESFGDFVVGSKWLHAVGDEYGLKSVTHLKKVLLPIKSPASLDSPKFEALLKGYIADGTLPSPEKFDQMYYMVYFPPGITFNTNRTALCSGMQGFIGGFHGGTSYNGKRFTYGVIGDCTGSPNDVTNTASHELIETMTDPYLNDNRLMQADDVDPWILMAGQENADMCEYQAGTSEAGTFVAKSWSNAAAMAGLDPCVPDGAKIYNNVYAEPRAIPDIPAGSTMTFKLVGWSTALGPPWTISIGGAPNSQFGLTEQQPSLSVSTIRRYGTVFLTLKAPARGQSGQLGGLLILSGPDNHPWPIAYYIQ